MPFHIRRPEDVSSGKHFYEGSSQWTATYADRKQYANESDCNADINSLGLPLTPTDDSDDFSGWE